MKLNLPAIHAPNNRRLSADALAGLSVAFILLPEAVAYAAIAHLNIQAAITAALVGLICYACLGASQFAIVAPTSSSAALLAAVVLSSHPQDAETAAALAAALVIITGAGLLLFAKAGFGRLSAFVSRPVLHGFSFALAITIISKQLPIIFGVKLQAADPLHIILELAGRFREFALWSTALGLGALLLLWALKRRPSVPGAFVVLMLGILLSKQVNLADYAVAVVGQVHITAPNLDFPQLATEKWLQLGEMAFGLLVILVAESWGSIRSLSLIHGDEVEPNRELFALGAANLASGLLQGMPVGAGFSVSSASEAAGAQTKLAGVSAGLVLLMMAIFGQTWIGLIPEPIVAAAVINALSHALSPKPLLALWKMNRDQYLALAAVCAVLAFGVLHGMLIAICLSVAAAIRSFSQPIVRELGELGDSRDYVDMTIHPNAQPRPGLLILRPEEPLFFASTEGILAEAAKRLQRSSATKIVIISLEESANLDSTAAECLIEFADHLHRQQKTLFLARVKDPIRELLLKLAADKFTGKLFWSVNDAVLGAEQQA